MTGKQKRYLRALASTMPAVVMIGKGGLSEEMIQQIQFAIEKRELIKVKVLNNCLEDPKEILPDLADMLGAELVQIIGHNGVLYKKAKEPKIELPR